MHWFIYGIAICFAVGLTASFHVSPITLNPFLLPPDQRFIPCCIGHGETVYQCTFPDVSSAPPIDFNTSCSNLCRQYDMSCDSTQPNGYTGMPPKPMPTLFEVGGIVLFCLVALGMIVSGSWMLLIVIATLIGKRDVVDRFHDWLLRQRG